LSKNIQTGLLSAYKMDPLFVVVGKRPEGNARSDCGAQQHRRSAPAKSIFFEDQARLLKRKLSLLVSMISQ
jgi:hypothetical protein